MGEQQMVEFAFVQVLAKDRAQAVLDPCRVVTHVGIRHEAELASLAHDGVAEAQDAAVQRQIERGFFGTQRRDFQRQHPAGQQLAVAEAPDFFAVGEFVQSVLVTPHLRAIAGGEAVAVAVVVPVGEVDVLRRAVRRSLQRARAESAWVAFSTADFAGDEVRCRDSVDARVATPTRLPFDILEQLTEGSVRSVPGVVSVTYTIARKPPSTIEAV